MTDDRIALDRVAEQLSPPDHPFERLERRRRHKRARQRVMAGVTGLLIAAVGTTAAFQAFRPHGHDLPIKPGAIPNVAEITCDGTTTRVATPEVRVQADGVHVRITNTGQDLLYTMRAPDGSGSGAGADAGVTDVVSTKLAMGTNSVTCYPPGQDVKEIPAASFQVVDPDGIWVSTSLGCTDGHGVGGNFDYIGPGRKGTPEQVTREHFASFIETGDRVERAGYPAAESVVEVRVVRGDRVIVVANLVSDGEGGWYLDAYSACSDFVASR